MDYDVVALQKTLYASRNKVRRWLHRSRYDWIKSALDRTPFQSRDRAMEIGPGSGVYLPLLCDRFRSVDAIDIEDGFLDNARVIAADRPNLSVARGDMTDPLSIDGGAFDLILNTEVIEHLPKGDTVVALRTMRGALNDNGVLVITTPQSFSTVEVAARLTLNPWVIGLTRAVYREAVNPLGHTNLMTRSTFRRALTNAGFKIVDEELLGLYIPILSEIADGATLALAKRAQPIIRRTPGLSGLLWTQCYVCTAA